MIHRLYENELNLESTNYFIFDSKGTGTQHGDVDFVEYLWQTNKFGLVKEGDLFLYRRPGKASETKKFYFFGAGKVGEIEQLKPLVSKRVKANVISPLPFQQFIHPEDLEFFDWSFKTRSEGTWEHFFNQYGMNQIKRDDFLNIINLGFEDIEHDNLVATKTLQNMQTGNYFTEDEKGEVNRRTKQSVFSNVVKANYRGQCALCKLSTKALLVGSHIIPWSKNKNTRLDPANGISLCVLHDKLFDKGYFTLDSTLRVKKTNAKLSDQALEDILSGLNGQKLAKSLMPPKEEYLIYHREHIFESWLRSK
jgi:putative restriction endonuclease